MIGYLKNDTVSAMVSRYDSLVNKSISEQAKHWVKDNKKKLIEQFASDAICLPRTREAPLTIFMAGSPGAGKTEEASIMINQGIRAVHIDADAIRSILPFYKGDNSDEVQGAAALGVEKLYDYVLKKKKNTIVDATFTPYEKAELNVRRSLDHGRDVFIFYIYQPPLIAWRYTKLRELKEGRSVPKEKFIKAFFEAPANVKKIKRKFGDQVEVYLVKKNYQRRSGKLFRGINEFDKVFNTGYNVSALKRLLT